MPSSLVTVDGTGQVYFKLNQSSRLESQRNTFSIKLKCTTVAQSQREGLFRLAAQEGFSEGWARLLTLFQTRWALRSLLLFSFNAFTRLSISFHKKESNDLG
jgi:hypothetical protein